MYQNNFLIKLISILIELIDYIFYKFHYLVLIHILFYFKYCKCLNILLVSVYLSLYRIFQGVIMGDSKRGGAKFKQGIYLAQYNVK